ncbi:hypothetical protein BDQ17DRAFT_1346962 [Cyathus striatus]|nr:hypothetical protein BDQ17DRAFT_1346962 [Cyathus striatus]
MQGIMLHRISAMYNHSKKIIFLMLSVYLCEVITMTVIVGIILSNIYVQDVSVTNTLTIKVAIIPSIICGTWIAAVIMEFLLLILALYAGYQHMATSSLEIERSSDRPSWVFVLVRDSILFPFITFVSYIFTAIWWKFSTHPGGQISEAFSGFVACVLGPRLILNLREAYYRPFTDEYAQAAREVSNLAPLEFDISPVSDDGIGEHPSYTELAP